MHQSIQKFLPYVCLAALVLWGGYVTLYYIGFDAHIIVLLKQADWQSIAAETSSPFLRGLLALGFFLQQLASRLAPMAGYIVVSLLLYGVLVAYSVFRSGKLYLDLHLSALHIALIGLGCLWLIFTTLFYADIPGMQPRLLIEPLPKVYEKAGAETLQALQDNYQKLMAADCLIELPGRGYADAHVYRYRGWCAQKSFVTKIFSIIGMLIFILANFLVIGSFVLERLRLKSPSHFIDALVSVGLGAALLIAILWFLALFSVLTQGAAWILLIVIPLTGYRILLRWLRIAYTQKVHYRAPFHSMNTLLFWLLVSYLAFNFLTVMRPFPIGWDDLGKYINAPRQMSVFGELIPGMLATQWEYITSLGFLLFGYHSTFGAVLAQQINWLEGLLVVLAIIGCTKLFLGSRSGILAALFYYTLPMVGHFSFADMKTENAILFFGVLGLMSTVIFLFGYGETDGEQEEKGKWRWLLLSGMFFSAGFATKPTIVLLFFMGGVMFTFAQLGVVSGLGITLISMGIISRFGGAALSVVSEKIFGLPSPLLEHIGYFLFFVLGAAFFFTPFLPIRIPYIKHRSLMLLRTYAIHISLVLGGFLIIAAPWMVRNMYINNQISPSAALGAPNDITPQLHYAGSKITDEMPKGSRGLPKELELDPDHPMCKGTARTEELDRYWGYGSGFKHYFELPWRVVMNRDSQGYYLTTSPILLVLPLLLLYPAFWKRQSLQLLLFGTMLYVFEWIFVGNGIPWYGIGMFLGFAVLAEAMVQLAPTRVSRITIGVLLTLAIATSVSLRFWQFEMQHNLYEFAWGKASAEVLQEMTIPDYDDIAEHAVRLSKNPNQPYLYRMGTFISYFIPRNLEVIVQNDNQLGFFNCLNQEQDHALTLRRLQALGIHSIVFDTNTATIEKDPHGTLHQKVGRFLEFANDPSINITPVVNNPGNGVAYMILPIADNSLSP